MQHSLYASKGLFQLRYFAAVALQKRWYFLGNCSFLSCFFLLLWLVKGGHEGLANTSGLDHVVTLKQGTTSNTLLP